MNKKSVSIGIFWIILAFGISSCGTAQKGLPNIAENQKLAEHSKEFEKKIYKVQKEFTPPSVTALPIPLCL